MPASADPAAAPDPAEGATVLDHVVGLELALLDPAVRADRGRVLDLLHPDFRGTSVR